MENEQTNVIEHGSVSIYDIADVAGVSPSTVSRALNDRDRIGKATQQRIRNIATRLGYQPSSVARSLVTNRTMTIGVVAPFLGEMFIGRIIDGIEASAEINGYQVVFSTSRYDSDRERMIATHFQRARVDAVIIVTTHQQQTYENFSRSLSVPIVIIGQQGKSDAPVVAMDDASAIRQGVEYLHTSGHRRFAFVGVSDRPASNSVRQNAFAEAFSDVVSDGEVFFDIRRETQDLERGEKSLSDLIDRGVTAVQCYNDLVAMGLLNAALRNGYRVPHDLSIIGFDDLDIVSSLVVPLTTIHQPRQELGRHAVEMVLQMIEGKAVRPVVLSGVLMVRDSTGFAP